MITRITKLPYIHDLSEELWHKLPIKIAFILPEWLVYWCVIRVWAKATSGKWSNTGVSSLTVSEALARWVDKDYSEYFYEADTSDKVAGDNYEVGLERSN